MSAAITTANTSSSLAICCPQQYASTSGFATTERTRSCNFYSWIKTKHFLLFLGKFGFQPDQFPGLELDANACVGTLWDTDTAYQGTCPTTASDKKKRKKKKPHKKAS